MFSSTILDVAVGLIFTFLIVSLAAGAIVEAVNSALRVRSRSLLKGVKQLFNDEDFKGLALELYQHAAINPRGPGAPPVNPAEAKGADDPDRTKKAQAEARKNFPAYIDPKQFAGALVDILGLSAASGSITDSGRQAVETLTAVIDEKLKGSPPQVRNFLTGIVQRTKGDLDAIQSELSTWFDSSMDRLSGAFKRWTQAASVAFALLLAVTLNLDAIAVTRVLWAQPKLADQLRLSPEVDKELRIAAADAQKSKGQTDVRAPASPTQPTVSTDVADLSELTSKEKVVLDQLSAFNQQMPIGWSGSYPFSTLQENCVASANKTCTVWFWNDGQRGWLIHPVGWLITALAALFGAPFWFDLLQSFVRLKGAGPSPQEKKDGTAASA
jgi:hypothetical protein